MGRPIAVCQFYPGCLGARWWWRPDRAWPDTSCLRARWSV